MLVSSYNLGQNNWKPWPPLPPKSKMEKWRVFALCAASSLIWGGWGFAVPFYFVQNCSHFPTGCIYWSDFHSRWFVWFVSSICYALLLYISTEDINTAYRVFLNKRCLRAAFIWSWAGRLSRIFVISFWLSTHFCYRTIAELTQNTTGKEQNEE